MAPNLILLSMYVLYAGTYCLRQQANTLFNGRHIKTQCLSERRQRQVLKGSKLLYDGERSLAGNMQHTIHLTEKRRGKRVTTFV